MNLQYKGTQRIKHETFLPLLRTAGSRVNWLDGGTAATSQSAGSGEKISNAGRNHSQ